ncbi:ATP-dependent RNA helicase DEAH12, chloroplastic [Araneus ventricosus]|uniref:ATP-dependent RNA helicase DEAH12, chloroplastic n=1 Tax=Araneus ventricosus TaxID=182803 RepID=A0A4Y2DVY2_ARAVE|nr:ATP-dependent RNA helicase DEAH12, chloroplastic [Araneus ventricosus]
MALRGKEEKSALFVAFAGTESRSMQPLSGLVKNFPITEVQKSGLLIKVRTAGRKRSFIIMEDKSSRNRKCSSNSVKDTSTSKSGEAANSQPNNSQPNDYKHFEKKPRTFPSQPRDFKETVQYQDLESYNSQRHHFVGTGLYNTDEIEDLPPRYRQKVTKIVNTVTNVVSYMYERHPEDFDVTKNPEIKNILDLNNFDINKKLSDSSTAKVPSHSKNHVQNGEKCNFNESSNRQSSASNQNFSCREETSSNSSNNTQNSNRCDIDVRNGRSSSCKSLNNSDKAPDGFCQPSHSKDFVRLQNEEKNSDIKSSRQSSAHNKNFGRNRRTSCRSRNDSESSSNFSVDIEKDRKFASSSRSSNNSVKSAHKDFHQPSHSRDTVQVENEEKNSPNKKLNRQNNAHTRNFSGKGEQFKPYNKSQNSSSNLDAEKDRSLSSLSNSSKNSVKSAPEGLYKSTHSGDPMQVQNKEKRNSNRTFNRQSSAYDKNFSNKGETSNRSYIKSQNNSRYNVDLEKDEELHQSSYTKEPANLQNEPKSNSNKYNRQIGAGNKNFNCKKEITSNSFYNSRSSSGAGDDVGKDEAFVSSSKGSKDSLKVYNDVHLSSCSEKPVHVQNDENNSSNKTFSRQSSIRSKNISCVEEASHNSLNKSESSCRVNADKKKRKPFVSPKNSTDSAKATDENLHHNSYYHQNSSSKSLGHSSETIHRDLKFDARTTLVARNGNEKDFYVPRQSIKKTKESGFFIIVNVSDKTDNLEYWTEMFCDFLKHNRFSLEFCCKFSESLVLNFESKYDALKAVPILKKKKDAAKNLKDPHITLASQLKYHLTRPCDCSDAMFENCKKYFNDFVQKFVREHKEKIGEVQNEMKALKNIRNKKLCEELYSSLNEKLDVLEKMQTVFKTFVSTLEEKLALHEKFYIKGTLTLKEKFVLKDEKFFEFTSEERTALKQLIMLEKKFDSGKESLNKLRDEEDRLNSQVKLPTYSVSLAIRKLKKMFSYECNSFRRCLPVYSKKGELLNSVREYSVLVISAETGSGKTTQLAEYLLQSTFANRGTIICTQPRKIAAVSVANFVCGQMGTAVGKLVGYDIGAEKKYDSNTKIIYMTDYALLKKLLRNRKLRGISCVIIDEAHERTLYTDLVLGMLKDCISERLDLRLIVTSATIDPSLFVQHFGEHQSKVIQVPGRTYPVEVVWLEEDVEVGDDYVKKCVETALRIHQEKSDGNILVFLTSPGEIDEAIMMFKDWCSEPDMPELLCLHGKCDLQEQLLVFQANQNKRKIIFATNSAETSLTIPGVKYVIDSGRAKEMVYYPDKNKSCLLVDFINKSSAEQRKGRAGRTQPGVCYRMYSKKNYEKMENSSKPEILRTNLQKAVLKLYQFGLEPRLFSFVEPPPREALKKSLESLEHLGLIKESKQGFSLTELGKKVVEIPTEPHLAKLVLEGIKAEIGYETIIVAALLNEAGRLFFRTEDIKAVADERKRIFCQENGDLCTYLEVYKRWLEEARPERYNWCVKNYVNSKALNSATKTIQEILNSLHQDLGIRVSRRYNNRAFKSQFEKIVFNCFSENLCSYSGHPKLGYFSPHFPESLYIHPSSALNYLKKAGTDFPSFLVYSAFMQTSRNFLLDVTPIKEETIKQAVHEGTFQLHPDSLKGLQLLPKTLGPFGESVLIRHILGKKGSKINNLESLVERLTHCKNFQIDVCVEKGVIVIYLLKRYHETVSRYIYEMVEEAHADMKNEEEIVEIKDSFSSFCLGAGGIVSDVIMPGEFKEVVVVNLLKLQFKVVEESLKSFGPLQSLQVADIGRNSCRISAAYVKVANAQKAMLTLSQQKGLKVKANVHVPINSEEPLPIYRMEVKWCRCPATGKGWVEFYSESDCITASGGLTSSSFYIENNYVQFIPSQSEKVLDMKNLPSFVDEEMIKENLVKKLPDLIKIRNIYVSRKKAPQVTEKEMEYTKGELKKLFSASALIDLKYPNPSCNFWTAMVYFKKWEDGVKALNNLDGKAKIDSVPLQIKVIKESHLQCKAQIYEAIEEELQRIQKNSKTTRIFTKKIQQKSIIDIGFSSKGMQELFDTHFEISQLLRGKILNCSNEKYNCLFTADSEKEINAIQKNTNTVIILDSTRKLISIFGTKENRFKAYNEVCSIVTRNILSKKVVFNISEAPAGFLKCLYSEFGLYLGGLCYKFNLKRAYSADGKLILEGTRASLKQAEQFLEGICSKLYEQNPEAKPDEDKEICAICLDPVTFDFHRLENCGHAFCRACLVLQLESKTIPLCCIKQNCGKKFYLVDIKKCLSYASENTKKNFYKAALHYHVTRNPDEVLYCPSPDCHRVFRVSNSEREQLCLGCNNVICTRCKSLYHYGMSCEFFQKSGGDEDFAIKMWMQEDGSLRKQCPSCQTLIEKDSGCNHMECANCNAHFCWLCLELFPSGVEVYDHLPYCPNNQAS